MWAVPIHFTHWYLVMTASSTLLGELPEVQTLVLVFCLDLLVFCLIWVVWFYHFLSHLEMLKELDMRAAEDTVALSAMQLAGRLERQLSAAGYRQLAGRLERENAQLERENAQFRKNK